MNSQKPKAKRQTPKAKKNMPKQSQIKTGNLQQSGLFYLPYLMALGSIAVLYARPLYLVMFLIALILNGHINTGLKALFKDRRPASSQVLKASRQSQSNANSSFQFSKRETTIRNIYGMPAEAMQEVFLGITYTVFIFGYSHVWASIVAAGIVGGYHFLSNNHNIRQTVTGIITGVILGTGLFFLTHAMNKELDKLYKYDDKRGVKEMSTYFDMHM